MFLRILLILLPMGAAALAAEADDSRVLFSFDKRETARSWQTVNDGVMGGRSVGRFKINENNKLVFYGTLSLANNGGFASVRARGLDLALNKDDVIVARVRGDGREYNFDLYSQNNRYSYRQAFKTKQDEWIEVSLPVDDFVTTWRCQVFPDQKLDPSEVTGVGFLLGDKQPGPFELKVDWIKVRKSLNETSAIRCE